jgi:benzylsuccinate CoA-transferase BbsF subunit
MAPHGVFPAGPAGADQWVALACRGDDDWRALCAWMDRHDLAELDGQARRQRAAELDAIIGAWTAGQDPDRFQQEGQRRGVPVHQVQNSPECVADPQLVHRHHYVEVAHPVYGTSWAEQYGVRFSRTGRPPQQAGPCWGAHTHDVLTRILGYDDARIAELAIAGALE